jgi:hypothetical protein
MRFYQGAALLPLEIWYNLVPARQGFIPWQAGTGLHLLAKE